MAVLVKRNGVSIVLVEDDVLSDEEGRSCARSSRE